MEYICITGKLTFWVINFRRLIHAEIIFIRKRMRISSTSYRDRFFSKRDKKTKRRHNSNADICRKAVDNVSSSKPVKFLQNSMVGQQRQQLQVPQSTIILCWKIRFKNQMIACSDFPAEAMLWIKEVDMVDSLEE